MTAAFFDWPGTGVAGIGAGAVPADRTLRTVARSFVLGGMDDLRTDFGLGIPRPVLQAAAVLADGFMIRTSFRCSGAVWRRHRHKPRRRYRLGLWDQTCRATNGMHALSAAEVQSIWRVEKMKFGGVTCHGLFRTNERQTEATERDIGRLRRRSELFCKNPTFPHHVERCRWQDGVRTHPNIAAKTHIWSVLLQPTAGTIHPAQALHAAFLVFGNLPA
jgi:hypothetical protein